MPQVGELLALHPQAVRRTAAIVEKLSLEQFIVLADTLHNKCRMSSLVKASPLSRERRAQLAWEALERGMEKRHSRSSGWTGAARLLTKGAENALLKIRSLDIGSLTGAALRVEQGPYREANKRGIK